MPNSTFAGSGYGFEPSSPTAVIPTSASAGPNHSFCSHGDSVAFCVVGGVGQVVAHAAVVPVSVNVSSGSPPLVTLVVEVGLLVSAEVGSNGVDTAPISPVVESAAGANCVQVKGPAAVVAL